VDYEQTGRRAKRKTNLSLKNRNVKDLLSELGFQKLKKSEIKEKKPIIKPIQIKKVKKSSKQTSPKKSIFSLHF
jgi:hypothetical protein